MSRIKNAFCFGAILIAATMAILALDSCESIDNAISSVRIRLTAIELDEKNWDLSTIDTARNVPFLSYIEKNVILEVNKVRSNPSKYADLYIKPTLRLYSGKNRSIGNNTYLVTIEGKTAVEECIYYLQKTAPIPLLMASEPLVRAAKDHVLDTGPKGITGHYGSDKSTPEKRIRKYQETTGHIGENIHYGKGNARDIVMSLLIDDGVKGRGHRKNLLEKVYDEIGVSVGSHLTFESMCVIDLSASLR